MTLFAEVRARAWQAGTIAAGVTALGFAVALGVTTIQKNSAVRRADNLAMTIDHPITGYRARLSSCEGSLHLVETAVVDQNKAIDEWRSEGVRRTADAAVRLAAARIAAADARYLADRLAHATPAGSTVCERTLDADRQVTEMLR
jgi:hypothetical protein